MRRYKICFVMPYHFLEEYGGGSEVQAWFLAKELAKRGYKVSNIAQTIKNRKGTIDLIDNVEIRWIKYSSWTNVAQCYRYYSCLKEIRPDLVIQRGSSAITWVVGQYCAANRARFIWVCSDNISPFRWAFFRNQIWMAKQYEAKIPKLILSSIYALTLDSLRQRGMKHITIAFTQNDYQRMMLKKNYRLNSHRIISGHDLPSEVFAPDIRLNQGIVLWSANLGARKRPERFIKLAHIAKRQKLRFIMIGGKEDKHYLDSLFRNVPPNLEWLGHLTFKETMGWFRRAAFFVNTSESEKEGFPNTYIQAWLCGVPVFSLGVDPDDIIKKEGLGFVEDNLSRILGKIVLLANHQKEYSELSRRVAKYARTHHSIEIMTNRFLDSVYDHIKKEA